MPNRIIRDGWLESVAINSLSAHGERFFLRLCLKADDFGRYHGNPQLLKSLLFPLKDTVSNKEITDWMDECVRCGLVIRYEISGAYYLQINKFQQKARASESKFPSPDSNGLDPSKNTICQSNGGADVGACVQMPTDAHKGKHLHADVGKCVPYSYSYSNASTHTEAGKLQERVEAMKAKFAGWYQRKPSLQWDHIEEGLMVATARREDFEEEWKSIVDYREAIDNPKFFPSGRTLLEQWQKTLDKARVEGNGETAKPIDKLTLKDYLQ